MVGEGTAGRRTIHRIIARNAAAANAAHTQPVGGVRCRPISTRSTETLDAKVSRMRRSNSAPGAAGTARLRYASTSNESFMVVLEQISQFVHRGPKSTLQSSRGHLGRFGDLRVRETAPDLEHDDFALVVGNLQEESFDPPALVLGEPAFRGGGEELVQRRLGEPGESLLLLLE